MILKENKHVNAMNKTMTSQLAKGFKGLKTGKSKFQYLVGPKHTESD